MQQSRTFYWVFMLVMTGLTGVSAGALTLSQGSTPSLDGLETALRNRLVEMHPIQTSEERTFLSRALRKVDTYQGVAASFITPDEAELPAVLDDLGVLVKVAEHLDDSETSDPAILFHAAAIRDEIDGLVVDTRQVAANSLSLLIEEDNQTMALDFVGQGDEDRDQGLVVWLEGRSRAAELLIDSLRHHHDAAIFVAQALMEEAVANPVDVEPGDVILDRDFMPIAGEPMDLQVGVLVNRFVPELSIAVRAVEVPPAGAASGAEAIHGKQTTLGTMTCLNVMPGDTLPPISIEVPPFEDESLVSVPASELGSLVPDGPMNRGSVVAIDGDTAAVSFQEISGPDAGRVAVYERFSEAGVDWVQTAVLELPPQFDSDAAEEFGAAVALSGDTIVVGAPGHDAIPDQPEVPVISGAAFVFQRDGNGGWGFVKQLTPVTETPDPSSTDGAPKGEYFDRFGDAVGLSGDRIVVGAPLFADYGNDGLGAAHLFERNEGGADAWGWKQFFSLSGVSFFQLGAAVAVEGDVLVLGGPGRLGESSGARIGVYEYDTRAGNFELLQALTSGSESFGASVALAEVSGSSEQATHRIAVGAPGASLGGGKPDAGEVSIYLYQRTAKAIELEKTLTAPNPIAGDRFGASVALTKPGAEGPASQMVIVGAPGHDHFDGGPLDAGTAYVYVQGHEPGCRPMAPSDGDGWGLLARRISDAPVEGGGFGSSVAATSVHYRAQSEVLPGADVSDIPPPPPGAPPHPEGDLRVAPTILIGEPLSDAVIGMDCDGDGAFDEPVLHDPEDCVVPEVRRGGAAHFFSGMDPIQAGTYMLLVEVDPQQRIIEMEGGDAEDNNCMLVEQELQFCVPSLEPNLAVTEVVLTPVEPCDTDGDNEPDEELGFILASFDEVQGATVQITRAGINATVAMTGGYEGVIRNAVLKAWRVHHSDVLEPARFFNPETGMYDLDQYPVPDIVRGDSLSVGLEVEFPSNYVFETGSTPIDIFVEVSRTSQVADTDPTDDVLVQEDQCLTIIDLEGCIVPSAISGSSGGLSEAVTWGKKMGNDAFNADLNFDGSLDMVRRDPVIPHGDYPGQEFGAMASLDASLDFTIFGGEVDDVMRFYSLAERDPLQDYGYFEVSLEALGYTLYSAGPVDSNTTGELPDGFERIPGGFRFTKTFSKDKTFPDRERKECCHPSGGSIMVTESECCDLGGFVINDNDDGSNDEECSAHDPISGPCRQLPRLGRTFFVAGIPIDVDAAAVGTLGISFAANVTDDFTYDVTPFVGAGVQIQLEVPGGGVSPFTAGARGTLTLCRYDHIRRSGLGMTLVGPDGDEDITICGLQCFKVTHRLTFLQGKIELFASYPWIDFCSCCFGLYYPCGITTKTSTLELISWPPAFEVCIPGKDECGPNYCPLWVTGMDLCDGLGRPACESSPCDVPCEEFGLNDTPRLDWTPRN